MNLIATPTKSLALHAIDGMLAYENIENGRRTFGELVNQGNIHQILNNTGQIVDELRQHNITNSYHIWPLLLRYTYASPVIYCAKHIPLIRYLYREIPRIMKSQVTTDQIVTQLQKTKEGQKWLVYFSFQGELDRNWCSDYTAKIPVLIPHPIHLHTWAIADELETALLDAPHKWVEDYFPHHSEYEDVSPMEQGQMYSTESKCLKHMFQTNPADLALMYITFFFPLAIRKLTQMHVMQQFEDRLCFSLLERHSFELLQLGIPSLYKVFRKEYPDSIPAVTLPKRRSNKFPDEKS